MGNDFDLTSVRWDKKSNEYRRKQEEMTIKQAKQSAFCDIDIKFFISLAILTLKI